MTRILKNASLCFFFSICLVFLYGIRAQAAEEIIAVVGDYVITLNDLKAYAAKVKSIQNVEVSAEKALNDLINGSILYQEAKKRKIDERKQIKEAIDTYIKNLIIGHLLAENVKPKKVITEEDARKLYEQNWENCRFPRTVDLSCIFIEYTDESLADTAKEFAEMIRKKMSETQYDESKEFIRIVKEEQKEPLPEGLKVTWKDYKKLYLFSFRKYQSRELTEAWSLKEGEVTEPVPIRVSGIKMYAVYKVMKDYPETEAPFGEVKSDIMMSAGDIMYQEELERFIEKLKPDYKIEYKKDPEDITLR